jgi:hypothetical protein
VRWGKDGVRLADVPNAGVTVRRKTQARGGNPRHDARSGKFGTGSRPKPTPAPANVDPLEYARMLDAVRDAARTLGTLDEASITEFVQARANSPEAVDIANFMVMVQEQRKADLVDILDDSLRGARKGKKIKLKAPRGHVQALMRAIGSDELSEIMTRLEAMGHDREDVDRFFDGRIAVAEEAKRKRDAVAASDGVGWKGEFLPMEVEEEESAPSVVINLIATDDPERLAAHLKSALR